MIPTFGYGSPPRTDLIVYDDMLGASGDDLNTRASSYGGTPSRLSPYTSAAKLDGSGGVYGNATNSAYYWPSASVANGDYTVTGLFNLVTKTSGSRFGLMTRVDDSVTNSPGKFYLFRWNNGNFELLRIQYGGTGGSGLTLATAVAFSMSAGDSPWLRLQATGTGTVTIIADRSTDGQSWTNVFNVAQSTNSPIVTAGKPGLFLDEAASGSTLTHCQLFLAA